MVDTANRHITVFVFCFFLLLAAPLSVFKFASIRQWGLSMHTDKAIFSDGFEKLRLMIDYFISAVNSYIGLSEKS